VYEDRHNNLVMCYFEAVKTLIVVIYRPPDSSTESFSKLLDKLDEKLNRMYSDCIPDIYIVGDFNLPMMKWDSCSTTEARNQDQDKFLDFVDRHFLIQMITEPTRGDNVLDLVLTNRPHYIVESNVSDTLLSDHRLVEVVLGFNITNLTPCTPEITEPFTFRSVDYHKCDFESVNNSLFEINWARLQELCENDTDGSMFLELFRLTVLQLTLKFSPPKHGPSSPGPRKSHRMKEIYTMKRHRRKLNAQIADLKQRNPSSSKLQKLSSEVNLLAYTIQDFIINELNSKEAKAVSTIKSNPKYFYSYAKKFSKTKSTISPLRDEHDTLTNDPQEKAELLQAQYVKVFSDPASGDLEASLGYIQTETQTCIRDVSFSEEDIIEALKELNPYSATPDGDIPARILTSCKEGIATPLMLLWKKSFEEGVIPASLKTQYITPIYKKGSRADPANYRPVSITSHIIKTFERVLRKHLVIYLESNSLMHDGQHGFRKHRSCLTQLIHHVDDIFNSLNDGDEMDVIYLDFAKAFDKVDHRILLAKLEKYGIDGKLLTWIKEFLTNRSQTVVVEGRKSSYQPVASSVPQGTVLGPVLFVLDIKDLLEILMHSKGLGFADDTKLKRAIRQLECTSLLQEDLYRVIQWAMHNNMELHEKKFEVLNYTLNSSSLLSNLPFTAELKSYNTSDDHDIQPTTVVKDLGVYLSSDRSWSTQINHLVQSGKKIAAWVLSVFRDRSPLLMLTLYKSMVRSRLEYCCPVWNPAKVTDVQALESVQRNFTRRINGCHDLDYWQRLEKLKLLSLQRRRERYSIVHVWKILNGLAPNDISLESYTNDRHGLKIRLPAIKKKAQMSVTTDYENSFKIKASRLWNLLPKDCNSVSILETFKVKLGGFLATYPDTPPVPGYTSANRNSLLDWYSEKGGRT
jgi:hypothetical protein